jgi:hypothetical protein
MGRGREVACKVCGHNWSRYEGCGMKCSIYQCDQCDQEKTLLHGSELRKIGSEPTNLGLCECGGSFVENATIRCPKCKSTDLLVEFPSILWD